MNDPITRRALELVTGDRNAQYGAPWEDHQRAAEIVMAICGPDFQPDTAVGFQFTYLAGKLARLGHAYQQGLPPEMWRDTLTDLCGYAECIWQTINHQESPHVEP